MDVSVIVPTYRGAARLPTLIDALGRQETSRSWELVFVLDGVVDETPAILKRAVHIPARIIELSENRGRPSALNAGMEASGGAVLVRCDDDLLPAPDFVEQHAVAHDDNERTAVIGITRDIFSGSRYGVVYGQRASVRIRHGAYTAPPEERWRYWGANCSVRRHLWEQVGPYDVSFVGYGQEDTDWAYRAFLAGATFVVNPRLEIGHLAPAPSTAFRTARSFQSGYAHGRFESKHGAVAPSTIAGAGPRLWGAAVRFGANLADLHRWEVISRAVDRLISVLPRQLGEKLVAWCVESASQAGQKQWKNESNPSRPS